MLIHENAYIRFAFESPYLYVTILRKSSPSNEDWSFALKTLLDFYTAAETANTRIAVKIDLRLMAMLSMKHWKQLADTLDGVRDRTNKIIYGTCMVNESGMVRVAINGLLGIYGPVRPMKFFGSHEAGDVWLRELIRTEDLKRGGRQVLAQAEDPPGMVATITTPAPSSTSTNPNAHVTATMG